MMKRKEQEKVKRKREELKGGKRLKWVRTNTKNKKLEGTNASKSEKQPTEN